MNIRNFLVTLLLLTASTTSAWAQADATAPTASALPVPESRGALLYSVNCSSCHASEIHWRARKLATDPQRLRFEVLRWKDNIGVTWSAADVDEVVHYLDAAFYHFQSGEKKPIKTSGN